MRASRFSRDLVIATTALFVAVGCGEDPEALTAEGSALSGRNVSASFDEALGDQLPALVPLNAVEGEYVIDVEEPPERLGAPYPVVFAHGFMGFSDIGPLDYFFQVLDALNDEGVSAHAPSQPPLNTVPERAAVLAEHIDQVIASTNRQKVHLICHSQGGLDCRYVASILGYSDKIANIITVATPHHGTPLADLAAVAPDGFVNPAGYFMGWLLGLTDGDPPADAAWDNDSDVTEEAWSADLAGALADMTSDGTALFNDAVIDTPQTPVFSVAAVSSLRTAGDICDGGTYLDKPNRIDSLDPLLLASAAAIAGLSLRRNDGIVPTDSMIHGEFLGCIPADHFDQIGQIADVLPNVVSGFDHLDFYFDLVEFLRMREAETEAVMP